MKETEFNTSKIKY